MNDEFYERVRRVIAIMDDGQSPPSSRGQEALWLVQNSGGLRLPVMLNIPKATYAKEPWPQVILGSEALCNCGLRRMVVPPTTPRRFWRSETIVSVTATRPVIIAPLGGDRQAAFVRLWISGRTLHVATVPYIDDRETGDCPLILRELGFWPRQWRFHLADVAAIVKESNGVLAARSLLGVGEDLPLCCIQDVYLRGRLVTIVADRDVSIIGPKSDFPTHKCRDL